MAPGTMLCDYSLYVCTFLSIAVTNMLAICFTQNKVPTRVRLLVSRGFMNLSGCPVTSTDLSGRCELCWKAIDLLQRCMS